MRRRISLFLALATVASAAPRPNVLLILGDDLGFSDLGCYGGEIPTPHLDELAREGLRFKRCYNSARCCPSRASLLTGLYPHEAGVGSMAGNCTPEAPAAANGPVNSAAGSLNEHCTTLAEVLHSAGYGTYMVGKWHVAGRGPIKRGFDEFYGFPNDHSQGSWNPKSYVRLPENHPPELSYAPGKFYAPDVFSDYGLEFLKMARATPGKPWFLYMAYGAAHFPLQAPAELMARFVPVYRRGWDVLRAERFARMQQLGLADNTWQLSGRSMVPVDGPNIANGYSGQENPVWDSLPADRREDLAHRMALYAAMVSRLDDGVGRLTADLKQHGELDNTLILFLSDNGACYEWGPFGFDKSSRAGITQLHTGEDLAKMGGPGSYIAYGSGWANLCNTPFRMYKHFTYEGGISTPLIAHWPAGLAGRKGWVEDPVHLIDFMPTLCAVSGATYPTQLNGNDVIPERGTSLLAAFQGKALPPRVLGFEHENARSLWHDPWKLVMSKRTPATPEWELYNMTTDRCEIHNVAAANPEVTARLAQEWNAWAKDCHVKPFNGPVKPRESD
ncbi:MAG: arylsulfatase [Verrucomicrobiota bacterium]